MRNTKLLITIIIGLLILSCSSDENSIISSKINPPNFIIGTWISSSSDPALNGTIKFIFTQNNFIEEGTYNKDNGDVFVVNYKEIFSNQEFIIEEETTADRYSINYSYASGEIKFYEGTNFRIPFGINFNLLSESSLTSSAPLTGVLFIKQ